MLSNILTHNTRIY